VPKEQKARVAWSSFATPAALDAHTFGYRWNFELAAKLDSKDGPLVALPEYYRLTTNKNQKREWTPVRAEDVPAETGLVKFRFERPAEGRPEPYVHSRRRGELLEEARPRGRTFPGAARRRQRRHLLLLSLRRPAGLAQCRHDGRGARGHAGARREAPPQLEERPRLPGAAATGKLADLDPALIVTPPPGLEAGYVPIVTRQAAKE